MAEKKKKKSARARLLPVLIAAAAVVVGTVALFAFRDRLSALFAGNGTDPGEAWAFEAGSAQSFAAAGNGLAVASSAGLELLDPDGYTVCRHVCALDAPAAAACSQYAAAYDLGGTALRVSDFKGNVTELDTQEPILSVTVSESGYMAVSAEEAGYKGKVTVYGPALTAVYEWYSAEGYLLSARVSPDGKQLAVLTAAGDGGHVHIFSLSSDQEKADYAASGELLTDAEWLSDSRLCALSQTRAVFLSDAGEELAACDFGGMYLTDYAFGDGFAALALSDYLSGNADKLCTVGSDGETLGELTPTSELKDLDARGKRVAALWSDGVSVYSQTLSEQGTYGDVQGVKGVLLRKKGDAALLYSASVLIKTF